MLKLYYAPDNASLVVRLALEEVGETYETILVDRAARAERSASYLAVNPVGLVPTLITPEGPIAETGACLLWLGETNPTAGLGPMPGDDRRGPFLRWLFYLSNTLHADLIRVFYPDRVVPVEAIPSHQAMMANRIEGHLAILDAAVRAAPDLFAPPSALSLYLGPLMRWSVLYPRAKPLGIATGRYRALQRMAIDLERRGSVREAIEAEDLGRTPFSTPQSRPPV